MKRLLAYITENPGQTCEQIAKALGVKPPIMSAPTGQISGWTPRPGA